MEILNITLNPNDMGSGNTLSNGNLTVSSTSYGVRATHGKTSGKWYWEVSLISGTDLRFALGISNKSYSFTSIVTTSPNWRSFGGNGYRYPENSSYGTGLAVGDVIGVALDLDNGKLEFYKNGVSMGISHTDVKELGEVYPTMGALIASNSTARVVTFNFGATPFAYKMPSGFLAYNSKPSNKILLSSGDNKYYGSTEYVYTENLIPQLTSDTSTVGTAIASSVNSATYAAWKAFDRDISTRWASIVTSASYVGFAFLEPKKIIKYTIACNAQKSLDWTFDAYSEISNTWVTLHQVTGITWSNDAEVKEFVFSNENFYKQYRINTTRTSVAGPSISSIEMMEQKSIVVSIIETVSLDERTIMKYGSTNFPFNSKSERKRHILLNNKSYNSGKNFEHTIDMSKRRVDKIILG
ncbi:SPRY domain-containing protein [Paenibacillus sp. LK1]|uniref:SPRY domain-containing protein n=1 Tax=Paenibacillus sp. LK1 TaxID=2053014 RepID=UPI000C180F19|nr:SPRY domain-containing protein [Paenibacillus sp. LK1]PIH56945.1 hypothetical protein CS562_22630 [Paenibacillus sp. LK1]